MGILQLLAILWARRSVVFGCFAATVALAVGVTLILPKSYKAKVTVLVNHDARDPYTNDYQSQIGLSDNLGKQVAIIKSNRTAVAVVKALHLADNQRFRHDFVKATNGKGNIEDWIAQKIVKKLQVYPVTMESSIEFDYYSPDADTAATVANAFADAYMRTNEQIRVQNARDTSARLQEQAHTLQTELEEAEKTLHDYQEKTGLVVAEGDLNSEMKRLDALTALQVQTSAETEGASAQLKAFQDAKGKGLPIDQLDGVADNQLLKSLRSDIATLNGDLAQIKGRYGTGHPDYTSGMAKKRQLEIEMQTEIDRLGGALAAAVEGGKQKIIELENSINTQKARVVQLQSHWDQYQGFFNAVKTKRAELAQILQRSGAESIESRVGDTSALVLSPAAPPVRPDFPNLLLNTGLAIGFGLIFGLSMAVLVELFDRRIRSAQDFEDASGAPVIVVLPKRA